MIVPMKHIDICAMQSDREELLRSLQRASVMMIVSDDETVSAGNTEALEQNYIDANEAIAFTKSSGKVSGLRPENVVSFDDLDKAAGEYAPLVSDMLATKELLEGKERELDRLNSQIDELLPWKDLEMDLGEGSDTKACHKFFGFLPMNTTISIPDGLPVDIETYGSSAKGTACMCIAYHTAVEEAEDMLREMGFSETPLPNADGTPAEALKTLEDRRTAVEDEISSLKKTASGYTSSIDQLEMDRDSAATELARAQVPVSLTDKTFMISGWVASDRVDELKTIVLGVVPYALIDVRDAEESEQPPTLTKNNKFISQFETLTDMFSRPDPRGVDPNPVMGVWYWIIFGMMMGDAGYGVLMLILFAVLKKVMRPRGETKKLINLLHFSSVTTIFWGIVFGSYFGAEWFPPLLFTPLDKPVEALIFSIIIGVLHIFSGMIIKMYDLIRNGHVMDAIFDQLSWIVLLTGIGFLVIPALKTAGMIMAIAGAAVILLTGGRDKPNIFGKISGGLLSLYNISSYFSDIVSYTRIIALMLSSGVIGMVMNLLASMVQGSIIGYFFSFLIYIAGHAFNLVMGLLSAYVHDSRLQYIEFFGKFYDGGGYAFDPLSADTKYVTLNDQRK